MTLPNNSVFSPAERHVSARGRMWQGSARLAQDLDAEVEAFRNRPLEGPFRYLWLDALDPKVGEGAHACVGSWWAWR
jgi:hypothetical protein